jgi:hypothetical protein
VAARTATCRIPGSRRPRARQGRRPTRCPQRGRSDTAGTPPAAVPAPYAPRRNGVAAIRRRRRTHLQTALRRARFERTGPHDRQQPFQRRPRHGGVPLLDDSVQHHLAPHHVGTSRDGECRRSHGNGARRPGMCLVVRLGHEGREVSPRPACAAGARPAAWSRGGAETSRHLSMPDARRLWTTASSGGDACPCARVHASGRRAARTAHGGERARARPQAAEGAHCRRTDTARHLATRWRHRGPLCQWACVGWPPRITG